MFGGVRTNREVLLSSWTGGRGQVSAGAGAGTGVASAWSRLVPAKHKTATSPRRSLLAILARIKTWSTLCNELRVQLLLEDLCRALAKAAIYSSCVSHCTITIVISAASKPASNEGNYTFASSPELLKVIAQIIKFWLIHHYKSCIGYAMFLVLSTWWYMARSTPQSIYFQLCMPEDCYTEMHNPCQCIVKFRLSDGFNWTLQLDKLTWLQDLTHMPGTSKSQLLLTIPRAIASYTQFWYWEETLKVVVSGMQIQKTPYPVGL